LLISIIASVWHNHELLLQMCEVITGLTTHSKNRATWLKGEVRENLGDFRKSIQILTFLSPLPHVPLPFTKTNNDLKRMQLTSGIKYWTSNPVWVTFQEHESFFYVNIEKKVWLLVKIRTWKDWQKLGDFIETKAKKSPTSPGLVSPESWVICLLILTGSLPQTFHIIYIWIIVIII
jgi:hypothetical protein